MAKVGDKIYLNVTKNNKGETVVEGDGGFYRHFIDDEIESLTEEVDGKKVIIWSVAKVKGGEAMSYYAPTNYCKPSACSLL